MGALRRLSESECRAHLTQQQTGRIAVVAPDGPHIIPVNYAVVDEHVIFRTGPATLLAAFAPQSVIAFEVEHTDDATRTAWSVVARGRVEIVHDSRQRELVRRVWEPVPWADGDRSLYLRLTVRTLSGRSVGAPTDGPWPWGLSDLGWGTSDSAAGWAAPQR